MTRRRKAKAKDVPPCNGCGTATTHQPHSACAATARDYGARAEAATDRDVQRQVAEEFFAWADRQPGWVVDDLAGFYAAAAIANRGANR